jgi:DNA-binding response OmpR family regulator
MTTKPLVIVACSDTQLGVSLVSSFAKEGFFVTLKSLPEDLKTEIMQGQGQRVIVFDDSMTLLEAYAVARMLGQSLYPPQMYVLAASERESDEVALLTAGVTDFITKPLKFRALVTRILRNAPAT